MSEHTDYVGFQISQHEKEILEVIARIKNLSLAALMRDLVKESINNIKQKSASNDQ